MAEQRGNVEVAALLIAAPARPELSQRSRRTPVTFSTPSAGSSAPVSLKGSSGGGGASSGTHASAEQRAASAVLAPPGALPALAQIVHVPAAKPAAPARQKGPSHLPAPKGAVWVAASTGDVLSLEEELARGGSTEEADEVRRESWGDMWWHPNPSLFLSQSGTTAAGIAAKRGQLDALKALAVAGAEMGQPEVSWARIEVGATRHALLLLLCRRGPSRPCTKPFWVTSPTSFATSYRFLKWIRTSWMG